jgi:hypothetical protein
MNGVLFGNVILYNRFESLRSRFVGMNLLGYSTEQNRKFSPPWALREAFFCVKMKEVHAIIDFSHLKNILSNARI